MGKSRILLAFANINDTKQHGHLRKLRAEDECVSRELELAKENCDSDKIRNASYNDIARYLQLNRDNVVVFHFGGHSNSYSLLLETSTGDVEEAHKEGLIPLLTGQKGLQLVFLNGCANKGQAKDLIAEGIPVVIATNKAIQDSVASDFACAFYASLASGANIEDAFKEAEARVKGRRNLKSSELYDPELISEARTLDIEEPDVNEVPWELYGDKAARQWKLDQKPSKEPLTLISNNLPNRNPNFTGRQDLLEALEANLKQGKTTAITQAIHGLGGVGKTQLAIEYVYKYKENYKVVWWINSEDVTNLKIEYGGLSVELGLLEDNVELDAKISATKKWLASKDDWLIVFDNVEKPEDLNEYLVSKGHNLITSRHPAWGEIAGSTLKVEVWKSEEAREYLKTRIEKINGVTYDENEANELTKEMGYLPLAIAQAVGYIATKKIRIAKYLERFKKERKALWEKEKAPIHYQKEEGTVKTTWRLALEQIEKVEGAKEIISICSYFSP